LKRLFILLCALLLIAGVTIITQTDSVFAQDDDGTTTDDTEFAENWCFRADRWLGQCDHSDFWLTGWYYICGYYMAQVEAGIWPKGEEGQLVADGCLVPLPPPSPPAPDVSGSFCVEVIIWLMCVTGNQVSFDLLTRPHVTDILYLIISPSESCPSGFHVNGSTVAGLPDPVVVILNGLGFASTEKLCQAILA